MGYMYIGIVCIVFFSWFYVCVWGGKFLLWIEDIDCECFIFEVIDVIIKGMIWFGFDWDGDVVSQFECVDCYVEVVNEMLV